MTRPVRPRDPAYARSASFGGFKSAEARSAKAESGDPVLQGASSLPRSFHAGFCRSITSSFQRRFHFLSCRSRSIAASRVSWTSNQTRVLTPYVFVNPGTNPAWCCHTRPTRLSVMPMYSVPFRRLARIYTKKLIARCPGSPLSRGRTNNSAAKSERWQVILPVRPRESGDPVVYGVNSLARSRQAGFPRSINSSFQTRLRFLRCRSRWTNG